MRIDLRIAPTPQARDALSRDRVVASLIDLDQVAFVLDAQSEALERLLEVTRGTSGSLFYPMLRFDEDEIAAAALVQPQCRKVARETDRDYRLNNERMKEMQPALVGDDFQTRLLDGIAVSKINVKPDTIAGLGEWTLEYIASTAIVEQFREAGLSGLEALPVFNPRTRTPHEGSLQLYSKTLMPPLSRDGMIRRLQAEKGPEVSFRQLGCLAYPPGTAEQCMDFNRTAEPFTWFGGPDWVLSARVRVCYEQHRMKGWAFLPVLEAGSALHRMLLDGWTRLRERVMQSSSNML